VLLSIIYLRPDLLSDRLKFLDLWLHCIKEGKCVVFFEEITPKNATNNRELYKFVLSLEFFVLATSDFFLES
jgi:hypothetical protein